MKHKTLSISIAAYNMQDYLNRCLDSILIDEVLDDIEVFIINDGSSDRTSEIAHEYELKYPQSVKAVDKPNGGHGSTINKGIELATGKYFKLLDADDWFDSEVFIQLVRYLKSSDTDLVLNLHSDELIHKKRSIVYTKPYKDIDYGRKYSLSKNEVKLLVRLTDINYKTSILKDNNIMVPKRRYYTDMEFCIFPLQYVDSIVYLDLVVYKYFIGREGQSMSMDSFMKHHKDIFAMTKSITDFLVDMKKNKAISIAALNYIDLTVCNTIEMFYRIMMYLPDRKSAFQLIEDFDKSLKNKDLSLYKKVKKRGVRVFKIINAYSLWEKTGVNLYPVHALFVKLRGFFEK